MVVSDRSYISFDDAINTAGTVQKILEKVDDCMVNGLVSHELLKKAGISEPDIETVLTQREVAVVVMDLYQRREIEYGIHWIRDWYEVWLIVKNDVEWLKQTVFCDGAIESKDKSAVKTLQTLCKARCKEKAAAIKKKLSLKRRFMTFSDFLHLKLYYC